jgi:hybrid cluster-associated redox disulfide protein
MALFTEHMSILEALEVHPGARDIFERYGMTCCACMGATSESIADGAIMHGIDPAQVVEQLNQLGAGAPS